MISQLDFAFAIVLNLIVDLISRLTCNQL